MFSEYDRKKEFETYLKPKIKELHILARRFGIPFHAAFAVASDDKGTEYASVGAMPPSMDLELKEDRFRKFVLLENGFEVVPHKRTALFMQTNGSDVIEKDEISDDELVNRVLSGYETEPREELTEEEATFADEHTNAINKSKKPGLGRPKGSTKEVMRKKREEAAENGLKDLIARAFEEKENE